MNIDTVKEKAVSYAKEFKETGQIDIKFKKNEFSQEEWYLIVALAQVYYNLMVGVFTREKAKEEQKKAFNFVKENKSYFERLKNG